jgi:CDP-glucose 4,6-dehydratase
VEMARAAYGKGKAHYGDGVEGSHEAGWLTLELAKPRMTLGVSPKWTLVGAVNQRWRGIGRSTTVPTRG